ncbi:hypothetical protein [Desulfopila sp. IMCC35008]|uniref:hypothetical protein n=1 Tax=Desulfopila sp. IMCC35008 TaxID=2653858 RepID=UPI0013D02FD0|nr:hypothetical protein [Desulfopila sp. IMCC35008]
MKNRIVLTLILALTLLLSQNGCVSRNMANINDSMEAEQLFTGWPLPEQYEYYYYGRELSPIAFLALDKNYTLQSDFWTRIFPTIKMKEFWQGEFTIRNLRLDNEFKGKEILSKDNKRIGMIYTRNYWVTAWFNESETHQIVIPPPEPSPAQSRPGADNNSNH